MTHSAIFHMLGGWFGRTFGCDTNRSDVKISDDDGELDEMKMVTGGKSTALHRAVRVGNRAPSGIYQFTGSNGTRITVTDIAKFSRATAASGGKKQR